MRKFIRRALNKFDKLTPEQIRGLSRYALGEIERLDAVLDSLSEGIIVLDREHRLVLANKYAQRLFPSAASDQKTEPFWTRISDKKLAAFLEKTLLSGDRVEGWEFDAEFGGEDKRFSVSVLPLVRDKQVSGSLLRGEDITEKRGREARLRRMENLASLTTVAAGVAHEIKNPLGSLSIHIQLIQKILARSKHNAQLDKYLSVVNEEIERLNKIVVDFLFAVRPMSLDLRRGDINFLIKELAEFVSYEIDEAKIKSTLELAENLPLIDFDERYMKQALLNLIKNAIYAMPAGGKLLIKTSEKENEIEIIIADSGVGIPDENLPKIFEPYFTTRDTGAGLGLTLVFRIVREHRGEITVKSKPGEGSVFTITLPLPQTERRLIGAPE